LFQRRQRLAQGDSPGQTGGDGRQSDVGAVCAEELQADAPALFAAANGQKCAIQRWHHILAAHIGVSRQAKGERAGRRPLAHRPHPGVVGIEDGDAVGRQGANELTFLLCDIGEGAKIGQVSGVDVDDDADFGTGQLGEQADFIEGVASHLQDGDAMLWLQPAQRDGQPIAPIVVRVVAKNGMARP